MRMTGTTVGAIVAVVVAWGLMLAPASAVYDPDKVQWAAYFELAQDPTPVIERGTPGWEYIVDAYTNGGGGQRYGIWGPADLYENMLNLDEGASWGWGTQDLIMQYWDHYAASGAQDSFLKHPSMDTNGDDVWELTGHDWEMDNPWHLPSEYVGGRERNHTTLRKDAGNVWPVYGRTLGQDLVQVMNTSWGWGHAAGLWFTVRIVVSEPLESLEWSLPDYGAGINWDPRPHSEVVDPDGIPGNGDEYLRTWTGTGSVWAEHEDGIDLLDTQTDWNTTIIELIDPDGTPDTDDEYMQKRAAAPGDVGYGVGDGILDESDARAGQDGLADAGVDFDGDGNNDVFHENYGVYPVLGNFFVPNIPGDFDGDGDVDADDVTELCANLGDPAYDLDGDGDADEDDMIVLIETLVELTDGVRVGTERGDFNLDGLIDGTDLALMKTAFGQPGQTYADGNANCDAFVDGTDLAILKTNFGYIAPPSPGGVPEPMTIGLLGVGGLGLLRRRSKIP
ncbi:hypothetical protein LCGC14_0269610 [marine sediment metagenome]|uniref:PEP-CTERM protein-sorting domain-containing protein n=1 Tax=marine sediment metagenome TaxID=412755 RepID=A0A0F9WK85_9ZZZZ|nr:PEP-CTERM sorting domain-containing protein [Phycisphaerae bacterium]HDZ44673.1 PEP-CTERM sorting domain-containing protein [Phycisphaerae bacterium]